MEYSLEGIGERLKKVRKNAGITQREAAKEFGSRQQVIQRFEAGKARPTAEFIFWAAGYYGISSDYLLTGKEPQGNGNVAESGGAGYGIGMLSKDEIELINLYRDADKTGKAAAKSVLQVYQPKSQGQKLSK